MTGRKWKKVEDVNTDEVGTWSQAAQNMVQCIPSITVKILKSLNRIIKAQRIARLRLQQNGFEEKINQAKEKNAVSKVRQVKAPPSIFFLVLPTRLAASIHGGSFPGNVVLYWERS